MPQSLLRRIRGDYRLDSCHAKKQGFVAEPHLEDWESRGVRAGYCIQHAGEAHQRGRLNVRRKRLGGESCWRKGEKKAQEAKDLATQSPEVVFNQGTGNTVLIGKTHWNDHARAMCDEH